MGRFTDWLRGAPPQLESKGPIAEVSPELVDAVKWGNTDGGYGAVYRSQPSVYTVVEFIAWQVSQVRLKVYQRKGATEREPLSDSTLQQLLDHPAPGLTYQRWMHALVADMCVFGNAYSEKIENEDSRALLPTPPFTVTPVGGSLVQAKAYDIQLGTKGARRIAADRMFHPRRYNPDDLRIGVSPLEPLRQILRDEREALIANYDMWQKQGRIPGYLLRPEGAPPWSDDDRKRFRADWQNAHAGRGNTGKTAVLEDGMTFKEGAWSPKEAEFIEGRKLTLETVARALNVPVSLLGLSESATYASQKEFHRQLYVDTLGPWFRLIEAEIAESIVPWFTADDSIYVEFNVEEKLRLSFEEQAEALRQAVGVPWQTVNEARALSNMPRVEDDQFDIPAKPANVIYGGAGAPGEAPMPEERQNLGSAAVIHLATKADEPAADPKESIS